MSWIKNNWVLLVITAAAAMPLAGILAHIGINPESGASLVYQAPNEMKARMIHLGGNISQWGLPLHLTGEWAIRMMVITLSCTPLAILTGRNSIRRYKKVFGIFTFLYTILHLAFYLAGHNILEIFSEVNLILALVSTLIIIPLGVTSNRYSMRVLRSGWKKLQQFAYIAAVTAVLHLAFLGKGSWLIYAVILSAGFIIRMPEVKRYFAKRHAALSGAAA